MKKYKYLIYTILIFFLIVSVLFQNEKNNLETRVDSSDSSVQKGKDNSETQSGDYKSSVKKDTDKSEKSSGSRNSKVKKDEGNLDKKTKSISGKVLEELDNYFDDIESQTNREIIDSQRQLIKDSVNKTAVYKLDSQTLKAHRSEFDKKRKALIIEWQENIGEKWPKYNDNVVVKGKIVRKKGQNYDAHHIIELGYNGENTWWNLTPAAFPNEHQEGIHRKDGIAEKLFSKNSYEE